MVEVFTAALEDGGVFCWGARRKNRSGREQWAGSNPAPSAQGRASRVSDDGSGFENRRAQRWALWVRAPLLPLWMRNPIGDGTGFETRRACEGLAGPTPAASAQGQLPNG